MSPHQNVSIRQKLLLPFHFFDGRDKPGPQFIQSSQNILLGGSFRDHQPGQTLSYGSLESSGSGINLQEDRLICPETGQDSPAFLQVQLNPASSWVKWTHSL